MKTNIDDNTGFLQDSNKTKLNALDLFDRVINLKLTTAGGEQYVIRSDYETYFPELMPAIASNSLEAFNSNATKKCFVRKCQYKPSIKVQYKRVSMTTPITIDIFISNFFMLDKNGKVLKTFNSVTNPLERVDVQMGYFGQFESAMKPAEDQVSVEKLFDFNSDNFKGHGITVITMSGVEYVQTDKLPPDMTVHIHGYVGSLYAESSVQLTKEVTTYQEAKKVYTVDFSKKQLSLDTVLGKLFFECVTKNWLNPVKFSQGLTKGIEMLHPEDASNMSVNGTLSDTEAFRVGVMVFMSKGALEKAKEYDEINNLVDNQGQALQQKLVTIPYADTALGKINLIKNAMGLTDFSVVDLPTTGNILIYRNDEAKNVEKMLEGTSLKEAYKKEIVNVYWDNKLPAVYNITTDALCTIVCPFFFFLNPFQEFEFKSAYALGGLVSYYANFNPKEDKFYALWQTVSFATVEDVNECIIVCTGREE